MYQLLLHWRPHAFALFLLSIACQPGHTQSRYQYRVEKISNALFVLEPQINDYRWVTSNITVIVNDSDVFVVDSGLLPSAATDAIREIRKITTKPVRYLLNTHWHGDHWQGNEVFQKEYPGIRIISSEENRAAIERNGMVWVRTYYPRYLTQMLNGYIDRLKNDSLHQISATARDSLREGIEQTRADIAELSALHPVFPNTTFSKKMILHAGNRVIELHYLGIGNTIGDAIAYLPKEKILITGDLVVCPSPYESGAFSTEWIETSRQLEKSFPYDKLIPGHGSVQNDTGYLSYLNALYFEIIKQINDAYLNGTNRMDDFVNVVTHQSIVDALNLVPANKRFTPRLDPGFIPAAVRNIYRAVINKGLSPYQAH